jgi:glycine C-acetyltransferase
MQGNPHLAGAIAYDLRENHGIFVSIVTYPVVEKGVIMLRMIPTAAHTEQDVTDTLDAFEKIRDNIAKGVYANASLSSIQV